MTLAETLQVAQIAGTAIAVSVSIYLYVRSADRATIKALQRDRSSGDAELARQIGKVVREQGVMRGFDGDLDKRVSILETKMLAVPTHQDLTNIRTEIQSLNESVARMDERSEATQKTVNSIHSYLLQRDGK